MSRPAASTSRSSFDAAFGSAKAIEPAPGHGKQADLASRSGALVDLAPGTRKSTDAAFSAKSASDAAAHQERSQQGTLQGGALQPAKPILRRLAVVDLLSFDPAVVPRLRSMPRFAEVWAPRPRARGVQGLDEARNEPPPRDRTDVLRVLSCARPSDASTLRRALAEGLDDVDDFDLPLLLVAGELRPSFDEVEMLRATVSVTQSIAGTDKRILAAVALGQEALAASLLPRPEIATGLCRQIEQAAATPAFPPRYVAAQVERILLEERKYKRRTLLGASRVRAELMLPGGGEPWLLYVPDAAAASLPLLLTFPVIALCEVRPREDVAETHPEALFAAALGRVLHGRAEG